MCSFLACVHGVLRGGKWNERVLAAMMQMMRVKERLAGVYTPSLAVQPLPFGNTHAISNHACSLKHTLFINSNDRDDAKTEAAVRGVFSSALQLASPPSSHIHLNKNRQADKSPSHDHDHDHDSKQTNKQTSPNNGSVSSPNTHNID